MQSSMDNAMDAFFEAFDFEVHQQSKSEIHGFQIGKDLSQMDGG